MRGVARLKTIPSASNKQRIRWRRRRHCRVLLVCSLLVGVCSILLGGRAFAQSESRIYGVIHTTDGEDFEGIIRWDKNEVGWDNILDGTKELTRIRAIQGDRRRRKYNWFEKLFGVSGDAAQSGIQFGYLERLEPDGDNSVILTLKGGDEVEFKHGSTDIGTDIREILLDDISRGEYELDWADIEWISFSEPEGNSSQLELRDRRGDRIHRIYGTLTTRRRDEFTGFIGWDYDESFSNDVLDGYVSGRKRKVRFGRIVSIERRGSDGSIVITSDGKKLRMEDSNDVDSRNNGITVSDSSLGRIVIGWNEFDHLELTEAPPSRRYDSYESPKPLYGVVRTEDDGTLEGRIIWDADEAYTWEILDGDYRDVSLDIIFTNIATIEKVRRGSIVRLRDGREFRLRNSNDIDSGNKGIFVLSDDGEYEEVRWEDFAEVEFLER